MKNQLFSLNGTKAIVTGGTGYLGTEICIGLAEAGAHIFVQGRDSVKVNTLVNHIQNQGGKAEAAVFDLLDEAAVHLFFKSQDLGKINILVNNAYSGSTANIACSNDKEYRDSYEIGLIAVQRLFKACLPLLKKGHEVDTLASCINISSMYGLVSPYPEIYESPESTNPPFYGAVKAALIQWTRYAAVEFGHQGIRVNAISPGPFPSQDVQKSNPAFIKRLEPKVPLKRIGQADELKGAVIFLASSASSYVNGINLQVDGGWTCV